MDKTVADQTDQLQKSQTKIQALLVASEDMVGHFPQRVFTDLGCRVTVANTISEAMALADANEFELALLPLRVNNRSTLWLIEELLQNNPGIGSVVVSQNDQIEDAAEAMRLGAEDCIFLPFTENRLRKTIGSTLQKVAVRRTKPDQKERRRTEHPQTPAAPASTNAKQPTITSDTRRGLILSDEAVVHTLNSLKNSDAPVFITGESGTGKKRLAHTIHAEGPHAQGEFLVVDCGCLKAEDVDQVLPAISGDTVTKTIYFKQLTRCEPVVQQRMIELLGRLDTQQNASHINGPPRHRFISSCQEDAGSAIDAGCLLKELHNKLSVVEMELPALRTRRTDIPGIATQWLEEMAQRNSRRFRGFTPEATRRLTCHNWPGNLRQLVNVIHNIVLHHDGPQVTEKMLPDNLLSDETPASHQSPTSQNPGIEALVGRPLAEIERMIIEATIETQDGSVTRAAKVLGVSPSTLYRKRDAWDRG